MPQFGIVFFALCSSFFESSTHELSILFDVEESSSERNYVSLLQIRRTALARSQARLQASQVPETSMRPGYLAGKAELVEYGVIVRSIQGINFVGGTFSVDAVVSTRWIDNRSATLVPNGSDRIWMPAKYAQTQIWLPDIEVGNGDKGGVQKISSTIQIMRNGTVTKVERELMTVRCSYNTQDFPFDTQSLDIRLASRTYMQDELKLVPTRNLALWGIREGALENSAWRLLNVKETSFSEANGLLFKSRGVFTILVRRRNFQYTASMFVPSIVLLLMSWTALLFPLKPGFYMPRIALSAIALLAMVGLCQKAVSLVPPSSKQTWMDRFIELCIILHFLLLLFNASLLVLQHRLEREDLAFHLDVRLIIIYPVIAASVLISAFVHSVMLGHIIVLAVTVIFLIYFYIMYRRVETCKDEHDEADRSPVRSK